MTSVNLQVGLVLAAALFMTTTFADVGDTQEQEASKTGDEISIEILAPPPDDCERKSKKNDIVHMHYVGTLTETDEKFDASYDRNEPFQFQLGAGQVIKGWDEGLVDMCVGEKRRLIIPPSKAYGEIGAGDRVPPNSTLTFEVELINITDGTPPPNLFKHIDENEDKQLSPDEVLGYLRKQAAEYGQLHESSEHHNEVVTQIFSHEDKDKDGFISYDEFSGPKHDEL